MSRSFEWTSPAASLLAAAMALVVSSSASGADLFVTPGQSIQAAIDHAIDGDRVLVQPGVYNEAIDFRGKAIEVIGLGGPLGTTLDATGLNTSVVKFQNGEGPASLLQGFTVTGGKGPGAGIGAIGSPTVLDCVIKGNSTFLTLHWELAVASPDHRRWFDA